MGFPEVSMYGAYPWGGFGANPVPAHHQKLWNEQKDLLAGGFLYSEGIFEDLNKVLYAQFYWQKDRSAESIMDEYIAYEFSPVVVAPVRKALEILETNLPRKAENLRQRRAPRFVLEHPSGTAEALRSASVQAEQQLSPRARGHGAGAFSIFARSSTTSLVRMTSSVSARCEQALQELTNIYYAQNAIMAVSPVSKEAITRHRAAVGRDL